MFKQAVREAVVILITATLIALTVYALRPDKIGIAPPAVGDGGAPTATTDQTLPAASATIPLEISIDRAKQLFDENGALFADARHPADFAAGHIHGARNLFMAEQEKWLPDLAAQTDPSQVVIAYCDGEHCHLAPELAEFLYFNGYDQVYYLKNGWTRWREHGFPVASEP